MSERRRKPITVEAVTAAVLADDLLPESVYYGLHGNRETFRQFERKGLPVYILSNRRCVRPSELKAFVARTATLAKNSAEVAE